MSRQETSLAEMLRSARSASGLELSEIARQTGVRREYLAAMEEDRPQDLPEPVYVRNFVKLYAAAVGLDVNAALELYATERAGPRHQPAAEADVAAAPPPAQRRPRERTRERQPAAAPPTAPGSDYVSTGGTNRRRTPRIGAWLPGLLMVAVVVALAVWGFNSTLFRPGQQPVTTGEDLSPVVTEPEEPARAGAAQTTRLSVSTDPPGARVLVDAFPLEGVTPIVEAPVTAVADRLIRVELPGYEPVEAVFDLTFNRNLSFVLAPAAPEPVEQADDGQPAGPVTGDVDSGMVLVEVNADSWLEIYPGSARSGTPLVYTTATAGQTWELPLPVFVYVGNAAGVEVTVAGQPPETMGSAGQVLGRAFTAEE